MSDVDPEAAEIEASRAPLLDHLIELRQRLIVSIAAIFLGFLVCFYFSDPLFRFLLRPFSIAAQLLAIREGEAGHAAHLGLISVFGGAKNMFLALVGALDLPPPPGKVTSLVFTAPLEYFFTKVKLAGFGAVILVFPVLAWQVYAFVAPGLYRRERRAFLPFLIAAPALFILGAALVYYIIMPFVLWFSLSQQVIGPGISVQLLPKVSDYFNLVTTLVLCFGLFFQLPVVLTLLAMAGMVNAGMLLKSWRFAVAGIVVAAAVVTPPDPISMTLLALPIVALYFVSIGCVKLIERKRAREDAAAAA
ncbi:MAG TPA: twin-arginine translocase subunit TatC [Phenylobacterium sp.]|uniref:twin-arginine translocase subunit TatC n=1 Tax=Phenylobacterium sp. TaxID=1871053 RepID=UPI002B912DB9|nr:twin-arginine translocase subunit TatC [Phenylobacterium sp.]HSV01967.1 twin-arginine translocase subunit TatC [Phenylobacterium sp.]